ncbi:MAG: hypothetical protein ACYC8T_08900 [Myxococcaceae bacterium]
MSGLLLIPGCPPPPPATTASEMGVQPCSDGVDNDTDGLIDCGDSDCAPLQICNVVGPATENTYATCTDGKDNDSNGLIDCADLECRTLLTCNLGDGGVIGVDGGTQACGCDDGLSCTADGCNTTGVCLHDVRVGSCLIDGQCYADKAKNPGMCQYCDPSKSRTEWTPIVGGCTAGTGSICYRPGERSTDGCSICEPSRSSTSLSPIVNARCTFGGRCYLDGERDATGCNVCDTATSTTTLVPAAPACTIAGQCYGQAAKHPSATCSTVTCDSTVSSGAWTIGGNECLILGTCYADGDKSSNGCNACIPSQSKTSWTPASYACDIGGGCYSNNEKHPNPSCTSVVCDSTKTTSAWTINGNECLIANVCRQPGDKTANGCQVCDPTASKTSWTSVTAAAPSAAAATRPASSIRARAAQP